MTIYMNAPLYLQEDGSYSSVPRLPNKTGISNYRRTAEWLAACGKQVKNEQHASVQAGCLIEEVVELLRTMNLESSTGVSSFALQEVSAILSAVATNVKLGHAIVRIYDREQALDALCDIEVTANGLAYLSGMNKEIADQRVLASNEAKLIDGKPVLLEGGKIGKPAGWAPPTFDDLV